LYTAFNGDDWPGRALRIRDFMTTHVPDKPWLVGAAGLPVRTGTSVPSLSRTIRAANVRAAANWLARAGCAGFGWFDVNNWGGKGQDNAAATDPELTAALTHVAGLGGPVPAGPYTRTSRWDGQTLNLRTIEMLIAAERACGFPLVITQGSYNAGGTAASAGTHDGGGALDVRAINLSSSQRDKVVLELRRVGFAAWLRTPSQGDWPYHIHAIAVGDQEMSAAAAQQVIDYRNGLNGLANKGPDDGPRQFVGVVHQQELYMSFYGPENWDSADWKRFEDKAGWKYNIRDEVADDGSVRDAETMVAYIHKNGAQTETIAGDARSAANAARAAADGAETSANAARDASLLAVAKTEDLDDKLDQILAVVNNPPA
jgi:hypothetical protein